MISATLHPRVGKLHYYFLVDWHLQPAGKKGKENQARIDFPMPDARPKRDRRSRRKLTAGWYRRETLPTKLKVVLMRRVMEG